MAPDNARPRALKALRYPSTSLSQFSHMVREPHIRRVWSLLSTLRVHPCGRWNVAIHSVWAVKVGFTFA
jgi:hypothetical protein